MVVEATVLDVDPSEPVEMDRGSRGRRRGRGGPADARDPRGPEPTRQRYGFLRLAGLTPSEDDVYISAQVRREPAPRGRGHRSGARDPRRGERHRASLSTSTRSTARTRLPRSAPSSTHRRRSSRNDASRWRPRGPTCSRAPSTCSAPPPLRPARADSAAARFGCTMLLRSIARATAANEGTRVIVPLIDERPEEATAA